MSKAIVLFALLLLLGACETDGTVSLPSPTTTVSNTPIPPFTPSPTILATLPVESSTPEPTPIPATPTSTPQIQIHSLGGQPEVPTELEAAGTLVLEGSDYSVQLLNLQSLDVEPIQLADGQTVLSGSSQGAHQNVSPDQASLAYMEYLDNTGWYDFKLHIRTADGEDTSFEQRDDWESIIGWIDNQRLALTSRSLPPGAVSIFDPVTGDELEILPTFLSSSLYVAGWHDPNIPFVLYDPTLVRALYVWYEGEPSMENRRATLWDVTLHKALWEIEAEVAYGPRWSPGGDYLTVPLSSISESSLERFAIILNRDGQQVYYSRDLVGSLSWSPDGSRIAGYGAGGKICQGKIRIGILNFVTKALDIYCVQGGIQSVYFYPVWSPDGRWIAINEEFQDDNRVILIDLVEEKAYALIQGVKVVGWMIDKP